MSNHLSPPRTAYQGAEIYRPETFDASPEAIRCWIRALPLADQRATIELTTDALRSLNSSFISIDQRARALALFSPLINTLIKRIAQHYEKSQQPFTCKKREHFDSVQTMLNEITNGYLIIINESPLPSPLRAVSADSMRHNERPVPVGSDTHHLCCALYQAIEHLAQRLLHSYLVYTTPPVAVWSEIHRLYYIAETYNIPATPFSFGFNPNNSHSNTVSVERAYKRILLFALANPYQLMPSEMARAYQSLRSWAPQCKIIRSDSPAKLHGRFYIDLERDLPPTHHKLNQHNLELPSLRLLDIAEILPAEKYQRALDHRLTQALIVRPERTTKRTQATADITLASGLAACHHYASNEKWALTNNPHRQSARQAPRAFDPHNPIEMKIASRESQHITFVAQQQNISPGGLALHHNERLQPLSTGALITYQSNNETSNSGWKIGAVRWNQNHFEKGYDLGIKCLAEDGRAVVTRIINADGNSDDPYHHSLLTPDVDPMTHPATLITPAGDYKVGDVIQIHTNHQQLHAELTQLIESSWAYTHYRFRIIASHAH